MNYPKILKYNSYGFYFTEMTQNEYNNAIKHFKQLQKEYENSKKISLSSYSKYLLTWFKTEHPSYELPQTLHKFLYDY